MKALLISDYSLKHTSGGAQRSNEIVVEEGRRRGHSINEYNHVEPEVLDPSHRWHFKKKKLKEL